MSPSVPATEVWFYSKEDYGGDKYTYKIGDDVNLWPGALNDKFQSAVVGSEAKVLAWQHANSSGVYRELTGDNPSLSELGGLSRFIVITDDTRAIAFRFVDKTGGAEGQYSLKVDAAKVGEKILYSEGSSSADFQLVGTIAEDGPPVTTAVYVRDEKTGSYIALGSIYFKWNATDGQVDIPEEGNFPKQLSIERAGPSKFIIALVSNKPST